MFVLSWMALNYSISAMLQKPMNQARHRKTEEMEEMEEMEGTEKEPGPHCFHHSSIQSPVDLCSIVRSGAESWDLHGMAAWSAYTPLRGRPYAAPLCALVPSCSWICSFIPSGISSLLTSGRFTNLNPTSHAMSSRSPSSGPQPKLLSGVGLMHRY